MRHCRKQSAAPVEGGGSKEGKGEEEGEEGGGEEEGPAARRELFGGERGIYLLFNNTLEGPSARAVKPGRIITQACHE